MIASAAQSDLSNVRQLTKELNQPQCPVYEGCDQVGTAPRDEAIARTQASNGGKESFTGATSPASRDATWLGLGRAFLAMAPAKAARRVQQR